MKTIWDSLLQTILVKKTQTGDDWAGPFTENRDDLTKMIWRRCKVTTLCRCLFGSEMSCEGGSNTRWPLE